LSPHNGISGSLNSDGNRILIHIGHGFLEDAKALRDVVFVAPNPSDFIHPYSVLGDVNSITDYSVGQEITSY
jgi:hypothetical protein